MCPLRLVPLMTKFSVFIFFQGVTQGNSWLASISLKDYKKIIWKTKVREMNTKKYFETLIVLWIKWTGLVKIKQKDFIDAVPFCPVKTHCG